MQYCATTTTKVQSRRPSSHSKENWNNSLWLQHTVQWRIFRNFTHTYKKSYVKAVKYKIIQGKFFEPELVKFVATNWTRIYERTCVKLPNRVTSTICENQTLTSPQDMTASGIAEFTLNLISNAFMETFPGNKLPSFTTLLPTPVTLSGDWQVALLEIS